MVNQNVALLNQVADLKGRVAEEKYNRVESIETIRSQQVQNAELFRGRDKIPEIRYQSP